MIPPKSERNTHVEISTDLGSQYSFPIQGTRLLGEITDCRAQKGNIEEESGEILLYQKGSALKKSPEVAGLYQRIQE